MPDACSLPRWKRVFLCVSLLICLFTVNCSLFTVRARANAVDPSENEGAYSIGVPFDVELYTIFNEYSYDVLIPSVNVFNFNESGMPIYYGRSELTSGAPANNFGLYAIDYSEVTAGLYDAYLYVSQGQSRLTRFYTNYGVVVKDFDELDSNYNSMVIVNAVDQFYADYTYVVMNAVVNGDGSYNLQRKTVTERVYYNNYGVNNVLLYNPSVLDSAFFVDSLDFVNTDGERCAWIDSASVALGGNPFLLAQGSYAIDRRVYGYNQPLSFYKYDQTQGFISIFSDPSLVVSFDDISWTDWLVNSVGAFMNFELVPNFSIGGLMALLIGMSLFMIFLKVFAGG